jgi:hypothetical protein
MIAGINVSLPWAITAGNATPGGTGAEILEGAMELSGSRREDLKPPRAGDGPSASRPVTKVESAVDPIERRLGTTWSASAR